jgi:3-oxoadipate enol-lactonase/4-carboxymuconolactone decarboxylase
VRPAHPGQHRGDAAGIAGTPAVCSGVAETGRTEIAYRLDGPATAPVLLLSNSLGTDAGMWSGQLPAFTSLFQVLRYEQRGHGGSSAVPGPYTIDELGADAVALLDVLGIERASICGTSLGGMVGMWVAAHHPERVERLVLACTAPALPPAQAWHERAAAARAAGVAPLAGILFPRWFPPGFAEEHPEVLASVVAMLERCDGEGYAGCCEAIASMDQRPSLARITAPTLVLAGADDPVTPPAGALELAGAITGASLVVLAGAAHLANLAQPERFGAAVLDHLSGPAVLRGASIRREVLGADHVERSSRRDGELATPFIDFITRSVWGDIWARPGLDRRTRSAITVALLAGLGRHEELSFHVPAALRNGLTVGELGEVLLHTAVYAGVPAANSAIAAAERALAAPARASAPAADSSSAPATGLASNDGVSRPGPGTERSGDEGAT